MKHEDLVFNSEDDDMLRNSIIGAGGSGGGLPSIDLSAFVYNEAKSSEIYYSSDDFGPGIGNLEEALMRGIEVKPDGGQVWLLDKRRNDDEILEVTLDRFGAPWDWEAPVILSRIVPLSSEGWTSIGGGPIWADDGNLCYFYEDGGATTGNINTVYQYATSTPYTIDTLSYVGSSNVMAPLVATGSGGKWQIMHPYEDGSGWIIIDVADNAYYVTMATPHSLATASLVSTTSKVIPSIDTNDPVRWTNGGWFNSEGTQLVKGTIREKGVASFKLGTPFDVSTAVQTGYLDTDPIGYTYSVAFSEEQDIMMISNIDGNNRCRFSIYEA